MITNVIIFTLFGILNLVTAIYYGKKGRDVKFNWISLGICMGILMFYLNTYLNS
jgi:hypothetical protein